MSQKEFSQITDDFIQQNAEHAKRKKSVKRGGPYSKNDKDERRDEVYRLHFEYGYSARKISEMMKVNRNTVNGDIDYWYSKIYQNTNFLNPEFEIISILERMENQGTRLREHLDKVKSNSERMAIERLIYDINSKILYSHQKLTDSIIRTHTTATQLYNNRMKKENRPERNLSFFDTIRVSDKAHERIERIINEDRQHRY